MTIVKEITADEMKNIDELRKRCGENIEPDIYDDNYFFYRFLAARNFNIADAETMLKKHLEWRKLNHVKNVLRGKRHEVIEKYCPYQFIGYDKEGCVVRFVPVGNIDFSGIVSSLKQEEKNQAIIYEIEQDVEELKKQSKKFNRNIDKVIYIADMENLSFATVTDKRVIYDFIFLLNLYINNYPERLKAAYVFNTSMYFTFIYSVLKTILPATILNKIHIYSDDSYKEDILKVIDAETLPSFLGGKKTDPDGNPLCVTFINHGGDPVPESCYIRRDKRLLSKHPEAKKVTLSRAAFHEIKLEVKVPDSYIEWEFETKCRDIGFGLFFEEIVDGEEKVTELVGIQRIDTEEYPETGIIKCESTGTYVIVFDNTYSWVRAKEIYCRTKVITPKEYEEEVKTKA